MFHVYFQLYKNKLIYLLILFVSLIWSLFATIKAMENHERVLLLQVSSNGIHVLEEKSEGISDNVFIVNFIRYYISYCYNYDLDTFDYNINKCSDLMSEAFWSRKQDSIHRAISELRENKISYSSYLEKIEMKNKNEFIAFISSNKNDSGTNSTVKVKLHIQIKEIQRTKTNPWGFEVENVDEEVI